MKRVTSNKSLALASGFLLICAVVSCGRLGRVGKPTGMVAVRLPATEESHHCEATCKQEQRRCEVSPTDDGYNAGDVCMTGYSNCLASCPGATQINKEYDGRSEADAAKAMCSEGLAAGSTITCLFSFLDMYGRSENPSFLKNYVVDSNGQATVPTAAPSAPAAGGKVRAGDKVLARYENGPFWFAGIVAETDGKKLTIAYLDGAQETLPASHVRPLDWAIGTKVSCNWKHRNKWYPGTITSLDGTEAHIRYDDGDEEDTSIAFCRVRAER
jgi:hypothetical protein